MVLPARRTSVRGTGRLVTPPAVTPTLTTRRGAVKGSSADNSPRVAPAVVAAAAAAAAAEVTPSAADDDDEDDSDAGATRVGRGSARRGAKRGELDSST